MLPMVPVSKNFQKLKLKILAVLLQMKNRADKVRSRDQRACPSLRTVRDRRPVGLVIPCKNIALIMTLCTSLFGVFMLSHGFIRDYISNGVARIEMYLLLSNGFIGQPIRDHSCTGNETILA